MNDFERQLSHQPLRLPPPEWRAQILVASAKIAAPAWTWHEWLWPSPKAWGALAAVWFFVFIIQEPFVPSSQVALPPPPPRDAPSLYAFTVGRDLDAIIEKLAL